MKVKYAVFRGRPTLPAVPESFVTDEMESVTRTGPCGPIEPGTLGSMLAEGLAVEVGDSDVGVSDWACVLPGGILRAFPKEEEIRFRKEEARRLLAESASLRDPEARMAVLEAAAALHGFDVETMCAALRDRQKPGDRTLFDAYLRNRIVPR